MIVNRAIRIEVRREINQQWLRGAARPPASLSANEREIVSAGMGMAVALREQANSDQLPSKAEMTVVVRDALLPVARRLEEYGESEDYTALRLRSRLRLRRLARQREKRPISS